MLSQALSMKSHILMQEGFVWLVWDFCLCFLLVGFVFVWVFSIIVTQVTTFDN